MFNSMIIAFIVRMPIIVLNIYRNSCDFLMNSRKSGFDTLPAVEYFSLPRPLTELDQFERFTRTVDDFEHLLVILDAGIR